MERIIIQSVKIQRKKTFKLALCVLLALLFLISALSCVLYVPYRIGQDYAISVVRGLNEGEFEQGDRASMLKAMYKHYNPDRFSFDIGGYTYDNSDVREAARDADEALGKFLKTQGYDCYFGSYYLQHTNIIEYLTNEKPAVFVGWIAWVVLLYALIIVIIIYSLDQNKRLVFDGDVITLNLSKKRTRQFMLKDVKSVELISNNGLRIRGVGINCSIYNLQNRVPLKNAITERLQSMPQEVPAAVFVSKNEAETLKEYKNLLDLGVITNEEFEEKKKQLLNL